jgi:nitrogenase iron protein NifH
VKLAGIIANLRGNPQERERVERFASEIGSRVLHSIPKDPQVVRAEESRRPLMEFDPASPAAVAFEELCSCIEGLDQGDLHVPRPLGRREFDDIFARTGPGK